MSVIPLCQCGKPAKIHIVTMSPQASESSRYYLGCAKKANPCGAFMWCKQRNQGNSEEVGAVEVYDELVLQNMELEGRIDDMQEEIDHLKYMAVRNCGFKQYHHNSDSSD